MRHTTTVYCPRCGTQNQDTARFCLKCGKSVSARAREQLPRRQRSPLSVALLLFTVVMLLVGYSDSRYTIYLNGSPAHSSLTTDCRPGYIWMGNPADLAYNCQWDTLEIDYVRVETLP